MATKHPKAAPTTGSAAAEPAQNGSADLASVLPSDKWTSQWHIVRLNLAIGSLALFSSANGYDGSLMNGIIALPSWNRFMDHPRGSWLGLINAMYSLGCVIAYPAAARVSNRYGRKPGLYVGYTSMAIGTALQTFAQSHVAFVIARLFIGTASGFFLSVPLLIAENAYPTQRSIVSALYNCGWYSGSMVAAWVVFATRLVDSSWAWRTPSLLQILLPLCTLPGFIMIDESPRWLVAQGRDDEARAILAKNHAGGNLDSPLVAFEMREIQSTIRAEAASGGARWADLWATKGNRHRLWITVTLGIFTQWVGNGVVSYYLSLVLETVGITYFFGYDISLTPLLVSYPVEIWPYALRAMGLSVAFVVALLCVFFNTFVNPVALDSMGWKYYIVFVVFLVAMLVTVYFTYPETRGHTLETIAYIFDGDNTAPLDVPTHHGAPVVIGHVDKASDSDTDPASREANDSDYASSSSLARMLPESSTDRPTRSR
ncbi:Lactose permease [Ceratocystis lukuohia]|uniref:Lactose permease n=1 Tax=Ceratocystis lukuohia TaxID=2019550 RepID=A0ABR4MSJ7_9PEZI